MVIELHEGGYGDEIVCINLLKCGMKNLNTPEKFRNYLKRLHMGEWKKQYWDVMLDGTQWSIVITYDNGLPEVRYFGSNAYPYNFSRFKRCFMGQLNSNAENRIKSLKSTLKSSKGPETFLGTCLQYHGTVVEKERF